MNKNVGHQVDLEDKRTSSASAKSETKSSSSSRPKRMADVKWTQEAGRKSSAPVRTTTNIKRTRENRGGHQADIKYTRETEVDIKHVTTKENGGRQIDLERRTDIKCTRGDNDEHQVHPRNRRFWRADYSARHEVGWNTKQGPGASGGRSVTNGEAKSRI